jgi:hypothetical protein
MKAKFLTTFFLLFAVMTFAQSKIEHLSFKGVPIDGTLAEYVLKMKQNGFNHIGTEDGTAILKGDFAGYKDCTVGVSTLKQTDLIHKIAVIFPKKETWDTLFGNYSELKEMLSEKYGTPSDVIEKFDTRLEPRDNKDKMYEIGMDRCKYRSVWQTEKGNIELSISHNSFSTCFVTLAYFDKANGNIVREKAKDDL